MSLRTTLRNGLLAGTATLALSGLLGCTETGCPNKTYKGQGVYQDSTLVLQEFSPKEGPEMAVLFGRNYRLDLLGGRRQPDGTTNYNAGIILDKGRHDLTEEELRAYSAFMNGVLSERDKNFKLE